MAFCREPLGELAAALAHTGHHVQLAANLPRARPAGRPGSAGAAADSAPARRQPLADLNRRPGPLANGIKEEPREDKVCLRGQQQAARSTISPSILCRIKPISSSTYHGRRRTSFLEEPEQVTGVG